ncbi:SOUL heme-binding domain containing protein [Nitzschia inconspicua]|uniref:SOUL heme-binding domain containing protein n=1 Tax=Nitzschia inconspicua TaxID=303405 RepID=A0A9K3LVZ6_9STRA|nr:SOUL heme-binding domain containing protein [Nitzschia inconspicua]
MGSIVGKENVAEPAFSILLQRSSGDVKTSYELREYGKRFVAEVCYSDPNNTSSPFQTLARYIGVFGNPQNEGIESIPMTAPVAMDTKGVPIVMTAPVVMDKNTKGAQITMTAPVVMENSSPGMKDDKRMKFFLPAEYDDLSKIPKPTNPAVKIAEVPPAVGAVHRYNGSFSDSINEKMALDLAAQLREDGIQRLDDEYTKRNFEFWGYNPPFTLPMFRRNEVWLELTQEEVEMLQQKYNENHN